MFKRHNLQLYSFIWILLFLNKVYAGAHISNVKASTANNYSISSEVQIRDLPPDTQEIDLIIYLKKPFHNENYFAFRAQKVFPNNRVMTLLNLNQRGACSALSEYLGKYFIDIERLMGIEEKDLGVCPIKERTYHLKWFSINFSKMPVVKLLPKGKFKIDVTLLTPDKKKILAWVTLDFLKF